MICIFLIIALMTLFGFGCYDGIRNEEAKIVRDLIERFRNKEEFRGSADAFITNGKPDENKVSLLRDALDKEPEFVREQICRLLVAVAQQSDPLYKSGINIVRHKSIVSVLIEKGLAKPGGARDYCLDTLQNLTPPSLFKDYGDALTDDLRRWPDSTGLLVVAKAKPINAMPVVDDLANSDEWGDEENIPIAKAALGDKRIETRYIESFLSANDAEEKARLARLLGFIGTQDVLRALASEMRTDLVIEMPMVLRRSVRLDIMAALSYNYPEEAFLYDNAIMDDSGYARVEKFCEEKFGIVWKKPRPEYLTIQGFPSEQSQ